MYTFLADHVDLFDDLQIPGDQSKEESKQSNGESYKIVKLYKHALADDSSASEAISAFINATTLRVIVTSMSKGTLPEQLKLLYQELVTHKSSRHKTLIELVSFAFLLTKESFISQSTMITMVQICST